MLKILEENIMYRNIAESDHRPILKKILESEGEQVMILHIKNNMEAILQHYIECNTGHCYHAKFEELIQPYFDDVLLLDKILRSDLISDKSNVIIGNSGTRIFPQLLSNLRLCKSYDVRNYLMKEFG